MMHHQVLVTLVVHNTRQSEYMYASFYLMFILYTYSAGMQKNNLPPPPSSSETPEEDISEIVRIKLFWGSEWVGGGDYG